MTTLEMLKQYKHGEKYKTCSLYYDDKKGFQNKNGEPWEANAFFHLNDFINETGWKEVIEPVDFDTAKKDVIENRTKYKNEYEQILERNPHSGMIGIYIGAEDNIAVVGTMWTKVTE